ncbi:TRAP transporter small permease [Effusibacillus dendaii]|uniref:TRAP transporter permease n=1 Tax=Effusibacillus dendaii TaxID=2743772 RepID=A0A7I8DAM1_9BACL|nr:TRAP transporter small permease [Effusibacillus dendaii]BCJ86402.1 TRAP transporter permease [Effusibacillus dendaii]
MEKLKKGYAVFEDYLSGTLLAVGLALIFYGVVMRYFMNDPKSWVDEISGYLVVWGTLTGAAVALREGHHIQVDILYDRVPDSVKRIFNIFSNLLGVLFCVCFIFFGSKLLNLYMLTQQQSTDTGVYLWIVYLVIPLSGIMLGIRFLENLIINLRGELK